MNGGNTTTNVYDAANQLQTATTMNGPTQLQKYTYAYSANGNRISRSDQAMVVTNYGWDQANRLTSFGTAATYVYNGDGLRMSKTVSGVGEPFVWDVAEGLPLILQDGSTNYVSGIGGLPLEQISGGTVYYFHQDQLGSTRVLTNASGLTAATYNYDAYGNLVGSPPSVSNPFQFAGQYLDTESGLQYLRSRYYEPSGGQFISVDPLVARTRRPYGYGAGNPLNIRDPSLARGPHGAGGRLA